MGRGIEFGLNRQILENILVTCVALMEGSASWEGYFIHSSSIHSTYLYRAPTCLLFAVLGPGNPTLNRKSYGASTLGAK